MLDNFQKNQIQFYHQTTSSLDKFASVIVKLKIENVVLLFVKRVKDQRLGLYPCNSSGVFDQEVLTPSNSQDIWLNSLFAFSA